MRAEKELPAGEHHPKPHLATFDKVSALIGHQQLPFIDQLFEKNDPIYGQLLAVMEHGLGFPAAPAESLRKIQVWELQPGAIAKGCCIHGTVAATTRRIFTNAAALVLENSTGDHAFRLVIFNSVHTTLSDEQIRNKYPQGAKVVLKEPKFITRESLLSENLRGRLGDVLQVLGRDFMVIANPEALEVLSYVPDVACRDSYSLKQLGNVRFKAGNFQAAAELYSRCLELTSSDDERVVALSNRAEANLHLGKLSEALGDANSALQIDPAHAKSCSRKARALLGLRQYVDSFNKAMQLFGPDEASNAARDSSEKSRRLKLQSVEGTPEPGGGGGACFACGETGHMSPNSPKNTAAEEAEWGDLSSPGACAGADAGWNSGQETRKHYNCNDDCLKKASGGGDGGARDLGASDEMLRAPGGCRELGEAEWGDLPKLGAGAGAGADAGETMKRGAYNCNEEGRDCPRKAGGGGGGGARDLGPGDKMLRAPRGCTELGLSCEGSSPGALVSARSGTTIAVLQTPGFTWGCSDRRILDVSYVESASTKRFRPGCNEWVVFTSGYIDFCLDWLRRICLRFTETPDRSSAALDRFCEEEGRRVMKEWKQANTLNLLGDSTAGLCFVSPMEIVSSWLVYTPGRRGRSVQVEWPGSLKCILHSFNEFPILLEGTPGLQPLQPVFGYFTGGGGTKFREEYVRVVSLSCPSTQLSPNELRWLLGFEPLQYQQAFQPSITAYRVRDPELYFIPAMLFTAMRSISTGRGVDIIKQTQGAPKQLDVAGRVERENKMQELGRQFLPQESWSYVELHNGKVLFSQGRRGPEPFLYARMEELETMDITDVNQELWNAYQQYDYDD